MQNTLKLIGAITISHLAGIVGSFFTINQIDSWLVNLAKPSFYPPNWIFAPVWLTLYTLIGISFFLILKETAEKRKAIILFFIQLFLNALWSIFFFGMHKPFLAFVDIIFLWGSITFMILSFHKINKTSAYLLLPYLIWIEIATYLNLSIYFLNFLN